MRTVRLLLVLFITACRPAQPEVPEDVLPDTVMRDLLIEFSLAEAAANINQAEQRYETFKPELFYESALKNRSIDRESLIRSLEFYQEHPKMLEKIYDQAISELSQRQIKAKP
ncbi:MAG: DUF4296 domain-containing protein [Bacteroidia bacterium]|jgi:tRNA/tmRNA/rRNA uracil-C5-methylase (TrmA/RlmC/RlmD family)|nr:DUF4296 domain-containing protein [Bacteroidia bacterium]MCC6768740.1 DUF4296 domain-containing protein [Bacteroidia bacterium]